MLQLVCKLFCILKSSCAESVCYGDNSSLYICEENSVTTLETLRELEPKCMPRLFVGLMANCFLSLATVLEDFAKVKWRITRRVN